jgi:hypothetical protein
MAEEKTAQLVKMSSGDVVELSRNVPGMMELAKALFKSGMFPEIQNEFQVLVKIEYGRELGIQPLQALQTIDVIKGHLAIRSQLMLALFQQRGGRIKITQKDKQGSIVVFSIGDREPLTDQFMWEDVVRAGLAGKDTYKNYPTDMMYARCISRGIKAYDPASVLGLVSVEEAIDLEPVAGAAPAAIEVKTYALPTDEPKPEKPAEAAKPEKPKKAKKEEAPAAKPIAKAETAPAPPDDVQRAEDAPESEIVKPVLSADAGPQPMIVELLEKISKKFNRPDLQAKLIAKIEAKYQIKIKDFPGSLDETQAWWVVGVLDNTWQREEALRANGS